MQIKQTAPDRLVIRWNDDHESPFTAEHLRRNCPCALCRHEQEQNRAAGMFPLLLANQTQLKNIELSGHNAIVITWGDGHKTGIFTWEHLRSICPCPLCGK